MNVLICNDKVEPLASLTTVLEQSQEVSKITVVNTGRQTLEAIHSSPFDLSISSEWGLDFDRMLQRHIDPTISETLTRVVAAKNQLCHSL